MIILRKKKVKVYREIRVRLMVKLRLIVYMDTAVANGVNAHFYSQNAEKEREAAYCI